jgi:hypothetical protein
MKTGVRLLKGEKNTTIGKVEMDLIDAGCGKARQYQLLYLKICLEALIPIQLTSHLNWLSTGKKPRGYRMQNRGGIAEPGDSGDIHEVGIDAGRLRGEVRPYRQQSPTDWVDQLKAACIEVCRARKIHCVGILNQRWLNKAIAVGSEEV